MVILTPAQMNKLDDYAITQLKIPGIVLMENAAKAVADKAIEMMKDCSDPIVTVFAGTGNNGGDGLAVARILENKGVKTLTYLFGDPQKIKGDARINYEINVCMNLGMKEYHADIKEECIHRVQISDLTVDALLGTGYAGMLREPLGEAIDIINGYARRVLSVDIPSGVNGTDGSVDQCAVKALETVTFCYPKVGLCVYPGRAFAGNLTVADIQIPKQAVEHMNIKLHRIGASLVKEWLPVRKIDGNKGDYGRVTVISGTQGMTGASTLATKAAYRTGSGLVYMVTEKSGLPVFETAVIDAVKIPIESSSNVEEEFEKINDFIDKQDCFIIGPGMGNNERTFRIVRYFLSKTGKNIVLDADGLNVLEGKTDLLENSGCNIIITPHPGEMSRLCGKSIGDVQKDRLKTAGDFATKTGVTVVLKGAGTVVSTPDGVQMINSSGCPGMSVAGSGDVLAGMIGSLIGQGLPDLKACALGVYLHGLAGEYAEEKLTEYGVTAPDIIDMIPTAYKKVAKITASCNTFLI